MNILVAAPYLPYEGIPHAGGSYLLRHLEGLIRAGHRVALIVPGTPEQRANAPLAPEWLTVILGPDVLAGRTRSRWLRDAAYRRAMNSPPAPNAESLRSVVNAGLIERARSADVVELHWAEYARFASVLRRAAVSTPIAVIEHDVDLEAGSQRVRANANGYRRVLGLLTAPLTRQKERRGLMEADVVLVFKQADEDVLRKAGIATHVHVIDPWLDEPDSAAGERRARSVLFTGALWRRENEDGVVWFLEHVWPLVRAEVPDATFTVAGAAPTDRLRAAAGAPGVDVVADVPDLLPYYRTASAFVAPLFVRGGLKFKVPQAMICGLPVVASTAAAEGVVGVAPAGCLWGVMDDPQEMASSLIGALTEPERAARVGAEAAEWCREFYSFPRSIDRLLAIYSGLAGRQRQRLAAGARATSQLPVEDLGHSDGAVPQMQQSPPASRRRTAIVHEWLDSLAGSEKVFLALADLLPASDLYALTVSPAMQEQLHRRGLTVRTTWLDTPFARAHRGLTLPLMPLAWQTLRPLVKGDDYDLVISSHHAYADSNRIGRRAGHHLVYVHTPARYVWSPELDERGGNPGVRVARPLLQGLDLRAARGVTEFAANSTAVRDRIHRYYHRDARVIYPPVDLEHFVPGSGDTGLDVERGYLLSVGRFIPYKRHDLALRLSADVGVPVVLAGHGPEERALRVLAADLGVEAHFCIKPDDDRLRAIYQGASALVFVGLEDFGIVPVEAQACGTPVIGLAAGGTLDTVVPGVSGALVSESYELGELREALQECRALSRSGVAASARRFSSEVFRQRILEWISDSTGGL